MNAMNRYKDAKSFWLINGSLKTMEDESSYAQMEEIIGTSLEDYECIYETTMHWQAVDCVDSAGGVSLGILERVPVYLQSGRLFETGDYGQTSDSVCILKSTSELYLAGARVGDTVEFMGNSYEVVGVIEGRASKLLGAVLIPYPSMINVSGTSVIQHRFIVPVEGNENMDSLASKETGISDIKIHSVTTLEEEDRIAEKYYRDENSKWLMVGFVVCLFAFLSIFAMTLGRSLEERKALGLHTVMGATRAKLFLEMFIQNAVIVVAAIIIDSIVLAFPWQKIFVVRVQYNAVCIAQIVGIGLLLAFLLSAFSMLMIKKNVCRMLEQKRQ